MYNKNRVHDKTGCISDCLAATNALNTVGSNPAQYIIYMMFGRYLLK